jgi:hypothetical protein
MNNGSETIDIIFLSQNFFSDADGVPDTVAKAAFFSN